MEMSEQFYTVDQAAERLKLHPKTVLRLIHEKRLRGTKIGKSYRILRSDMESFCGAQPRAKPISTLARVSCAVDLPEVSISVSERLATMLNAAVTIDVARPDPLHFSTIYNPETRHFKVVIFGAPLDVVALLTTLHRFTEALQ